MPEPIEIAKRVLENNEWRHRYELEEFYLELTDKAKKEVGKDSMGPYYRIVENTIHPQTKVKMPLTRMRYSHLMLDHWKVDIAKEDAEWVLECLEAVAQVVQEQDSRISAMLVCIDALNTELDSRSNQVANQQAEITDLRRTLDRNNKEAAAGMYLLKEERERLRGEIGRLKEELIITTRNAEAFRASLVPTLEVAEERGTEINRLRAALEKPPLGCHTYVMTYDAQGKVIGADIGCSHWQQAFNEVQNEYHSLIDDYAEVKSKLMDYEATFPLRQWLWVKRLLGQGQEGGED
jgi:hypothetical protein